MTNDVETQKEILSWCITVKVPIKFMSMARKMYTIILIMQGKAFFPGNNPKVQCRYNVERLGGPNYGAWDIFPDEIDSHSIIYSFGIGKDASFDMDLINRYGVTVHAFDPTPSSIDWIDKQRFPSNFIMHKYGIANHDGEVPLYQNDNPEYVSHTILPKYQRGKTPVIVPVKRLSSIVKQLGHKKIDILKMDIEGAEYQVIEDIFESNIRPTQILIEFHHGQYPNIGISKTKQAIKILNDMGYCLFSVSSSGPEFSFIKREK